MRNLIFVVFASLLIAATPSTQTAATRLFTEPGAPKGWVVRQWNEVSKPAPPEAKWAVNEEGILGGSETRGTWLMSEQEYGDFELTLEFKLPPRGNSGVALRAP